MTDHDERVEEAPRDPERKKPWLPVAGPIAKGMWTTFKQVFRRFYRSIQEPDAEPEYPQFTDGLRQLTILETELASHQRRAWMEVST